jgi:hypothetical protein
VTRVAAPLTPVFVAPLTETKDRIDQHKFDIFPARDALTAAETVRGLSHALLMVLTGEPDGSPEDWIVTIGGIGSFVEDIVPDICQQHELQLQFPYSNTRGQSFPGGMIHGP